MGVAEWIADRTSLSLRAGGLWAGFGGFEGG